MGLIALVEPVGVLERGGRVVESVLLARRWLGCLLLPEERVSAGAEVVGDIVSLSLSLSSELSTGQELRLLPSFNIATGEVPERAS